ncbi:MAG: glutamine--fructose-6-phosphate transaminase (isomerizing) [Planctomycetes bacterium]|nr:glutamine--fructose-6-phosphate transaminase (isomerizing) [Planctomycetota bacterium]
MCGIVGYTGPGQALGFVIEGLARLEYRGYDSAGVAHTGSKGLKVHRAAGRVADLRAALSSAAVPLDGPGAAIGHTRWATHGPPTERNAHPHRDQAGDIALVHNGIIENHAELRAKLEAQGCVFKSDTDTEAAAHLIGKLYQGDLLRAVERALEMIEGSFAFAVLSSKEPGRLVGARRGSPLVVGLGAGNKEFFLASDALPIVERTKTVLYLNDDEIVALKPGEIQIRHRGKPVEPKTQELHWSAEDAERGGFEHFMLKEIHEQPAALRRLAVELIASPGSPEGQPPAFRLEHLGLDAARLQAVQRIVILGQGTSYHAGLVGRNMIERTARVPVQVEYGSDFRYRDPVVDPNVLVLAVSQSGETADTLGGVRLAKDLGCPTLSVVNVTGSTMARESDGVIYMHVGPEIGVASTKAFTGQIAALYVFAIHLGLVRGTLSPADAHRRAQDLLQVPARIEEALGQAPAVKKIAETLKDAEHALYLGRGTGFPLALEGALKLKEVSYIHAEGYDAAEMKHGPIALIDEKMPVVVLALQGRRYEKIRSNIQEVKARGGRVIAIASHDDAHIAGAVDEVLRVRDDRGIMNALVCAVPLQLIAYYIAVVRGCDVDKPRNLAKSVTVE